MGELIALAVYCINLVLIIGWVCNGVKTWIFFPYVLVTCILPVFAWAIYEILSIAAMA